MEKVSVIISTYHRGFLTIRRAILSVINQTYKNVEIVVVDDNEDGSDFSGEVCAGLKESFPSVKYLSYNGNRGACFARNYGADNTDGEYIAFLDDDDAWHPDKLEKQMNYIKEKGCVLVSCNCCKVLLDKTGNEVNKSDENRFCEGEITLQEILNDNVIGGCSFPLMRREAFKQAGEFLVGLPSSQDYELWIRIAQQGKIWFISEPLLDYYVSQSERITKNVDGKIKSYTFLINEYADLATDKKLYKARKYIVLAKVCFRFGHFRKGLQFNHKAIGCKISVEIIRGSFRNIILGIARLFKTN